MKIKTGTLFMMFTLALLQENRGQVTGNSLQARNSSADSQVTTGEYCQFLNEVAATDLYDLYNEKLEAIERSGEPGNYSYSVTDGKQNAAVTYIDQQSAMCYCNWLENAPSTLNLNCCGADSHLRSNRIPLQIATSSSTDLTEKNNSDERTWGTFAGDCLLVGAAVGVVVVARSAGYCGGGESRTRTHSDSFSYYEEDVETPVPPGGSRHRTVREQVDDLSKRVQETLFGKPQNKASINVQASWGSRQFGGLVYTTLPNINSQEIREGCQQIREDRERDLALNNRQNLLTDHLVTAQQKRKKRVTTLHAKAAENQQNLLTIQERRRQTASSHNRTITQTMDENSWDHAGMMVQEEQQGHYRNRTQVLDQNNIIFYHSLNPHMRPSYPPEEQGGYITDHGEDYSIDSSEDEDDLANNQQRKKRGALWNQWNQPPSLNTNIRGSSSSSASHSLTLQEELDNIPLYYTSDEEQIGENNHAGYGNVERETSSPFSSLGNNSSSHRTTAPAHSSQTKTQNSFWHWLEWH